MTFVLKLPHRPRSAVITISSTRPPARGVARSSSSGCADGSTRDARLFSTRRICIANGRACWMRSCARRSLRRGDHLHRLRDLLRRLDRADPAADIEQ